METIIDKFRELIQLWNREPLNLYIFKLFATLISSLLTFQHNAWLPASNRTLNSTYDFVIIGGSTAGIVLASTLANSNPNYKILLIEAGSNPPLTSNIPYFSAILADTEYNWNYVAEPQTTACQGYIKNRCHLACGKMLGGSTLMQTMAYTTGTKRDWNRWKILGNLLWNWNNVLEYFNSFIKNVSLCSFTDFLGQSDQLQPLRDILFSAAQILGFQQITDNFDSVTGKIGYGKLYGTLKNGKHNHPGETFLKLALKNNNFHVLTEHLVINIKINPETKQVFGLEYVPIGKQKTWELSKQMVTVEKEVILCAGAINNAKLLMLSGIGPKDHLEEKNIFVINNLNGVGKNLQDHVYFPGIFHLIRNASWSEHLDDVEAAELFILKNRGPFSSIGLSDTVGYVLAAPDEQSNYPDVRINHFYIYKNSVHTHFLIQYPFGERIRNFLESHNQNSSILVQIPMLLKPKSRGRIFLKDSNPFSRPLIYPQYLTSRDDLQTLIRAAKHAVKIGETEPMKGVGAELLDLGKEFCPNYYSSNDDEIWKCLLQIFATSSGHFVGTTRMGKCPKCYNAVVNERLQVHGIKNLRVADASIMPEIIGGDLYASNIMIAQRAANFIIANGSAECDGSGDFCFKKIEQNNEFC